MPAFQHLTNFQDSKLGLRASVINNDKLHQEQNQAYGEKLRILSILCGLIAFEMLYSWSVFIVFVFRLSLEEYYLPIIRLC